MSRILVIDDNENLGTGVALLLERQGHEAVAVTSGAAGMAAMRQNSFDLVLTDYRMDEMDGLAVLRAVKEEFPDRVKMEIVRHREQCDVRYVAKDDDTAWALIGLVAFMNIDHRQSLLTDHLAQMRRFMPPDRLREIS